MRLKRSLSLSPSISGDNLDAVHDITVAYPKNIPQTERHLVLGLFPREIHFHVRRYPVSSLPAGSEALQAWCQERWAEKEQRLRDFYAGEPRCFDTPEARVPPCKTELRVTLIKVASLVYWTVFVALSFAGLWLYASVRFYLLLVVAFFLVQQRLVGGVELMEMACYRYWMSGSHGDGGRSSGVKEEVGNGMEKKKE